MQEALDLYAILKVGKTARKDTIRRAFHKLAKKSHPDCGGDRETFERIQFAYDVLSDEAKRARYDSTGEYADGKPDNDLASMMTVLNSYYVDAINKILSQGRNPHQAKIQDMMKQGVKSKIDEIRNGTREPAKRMDAIKKMVGRWTAKRQPNLMEQSTAVMINELEQNLKRADEAIALLNRASEFLSDFEYRNDPEEVKPFTAAQMIVGMRGNGFVWQSP